MNWTTVRVPMFLVFALHLIFATTPSSAQSTVFRRRNANSDGAVDISDGIRTLRFLFLGGEVPPCRDATDANDSGGLDVPDGVYVFKFLFRRGSQRPAPFASCGENPTPDNLECEAVAACDQNRRPSARFTVAPTLARTSHQIS